MLTASCQDQRRRTLKLAQTNLSCDDLMVTIENPAQLDASEKAALLNNCSSYNLSFYRCASPCDRQTLLAFWCQLGLSGVVANPESGEDGISHIQVKSNSRYIPYTDKALLWHTDGYYNAGTKTIRAFAMHCVRTAATGGSNYFFDPEILCLLIHDENPHYINALMHPLAMTIPADSNRGTRGRGEVSVPMLSYINGKLLFRYTERSCSVRWRDDPMLMKARAFIHHTLRHTTRYRLICRLNANEGVVCNNVLHSRTAFTQASSGNAIPGRLLYRARFHNTVA